MTRLVLSFPSSYSALHLAMLCLANYARVTGPGRTVGDTLEVLQASDLNWSSGNIICQAPPELSLDVISATDG